MQITLKTKVMGKWKDIPIASDDFDKVKALAGTQSILEIVIDRNGAPFKEYYCCNDELFEQMRKVHQGGKTKVVMKGDGVAAFRETELYDKVIRTFYTQEDVDIAFPEKENETKAWSQQGLHDVGEDSSVPDMSEE